jgi:hypothetical protein
MDMVIFELPMLVWWYFKLPVMIMVIFELRVILYRI